ncbi:TonB-dependent siderophore receptor [Flavobacterium sp. RHBU_3]|uniref:TonB-dependent siderophore receptor n=1 Tax=Flavobacterium sp. RHBU_3 TaxID=3391184 RepID=UPI0039846AF2
MNNSIFKQTLTLIALLFGFALSAQDRGNVSGTIVLSDNTPAENISVALKNTNYSAVTNAKGHYEIKNVKVGEYTIRVVSVGIKTVEQNIAVAAGQTATANITLNESQEELNEVVINGGTNRYSKQEAVSSSRIPLKAIENAQVSNVVTQQLMKDQLITNQDDALKNVPGLYQMWGATGRAGDGGSYYVSRGFTTQALVRNGVAGTVIANNDAANIEYIEAIKGPSATLFGSILTSYGGLINRVTKKPYDRFGGEVNFQTGSYGFNRGTVDVNTPLNADKTALFRLNAATTKSESFQDTGMSKNFFFAPSFTYKFSDRLTATIEAEFFNQDATGLNLIYLGDSPSNIGIHNAADLNYDFKRSMNGSNFVTQTKSRNFFATFNYKMSDNWTSQSILTSANNEAAGPGTWLYLLANNQMSRNAWGFEGSSNAVEFQQNFTGDFKIGSMRNRMVIGGDIYHTKGYYLITYLPGFQWTFDTVDYTGSIANYNAFNQHTIQNMLDGSDSFYKGSSDYSTNSVYVNDVLNITPRLLVSAGVRFDNYENRGSYDAASNTRSGAFSQNAFSPKFGAVYQIVEDQVSLFANYQNSFKNVVNSYAGSTDPNVNGAVFKPEHANQFEAGVKANAFNNKLSGSVSYYNIEVENIVRTDPSNPISSIQDGTQLSKGIEAEITASPIEGLNIIAGYAYNDSKLTKADAGVNNLRPYTAGPQNLANFWVSYKLPENTIKGLGLGVGGNYGSESLIYNQNTLDSDGNVTGRDTFVLPSYTVLNASVFYDQPKYRVTFRVNNLTDELYFNGYTTINVQAPRTFVGGISYKF